ncbi:MAG: phosphatidate cytidylyltransferase [Verrucomicrobia bacterium]|nr:phosphatidate cytidylyltransferase [Verrucomicrobiota bacterium]
MPVEQQLVAAPPPKSKAGILARRLGSSVALWAVVIATLFSESKIVSDYVFLAVMMAIAGLGLAEFYDLIGRRQVACFKDWGIFGGVLLMASTFVYLSGLMQPQLHPAKANDFETSFLILFVLGLCLRQLAAGTNTTAFFAISSTLLGLMYVPWLLNFIQKIKFFPNINGAYYVLYFVLVTKFSDLGAYVVGSLIGKHKMSPRISPGKTWEGFGGAILFSTIASVIFVGVAHSKLQHMSLGHAVFLGIALGAAAVVGDLVESLFKREAGVKDSGRLFPGIGGMLDLMDSLLFNAPLMYLYLRHVLTR